jgi:hypothetical protein
MWTPLSLVMGVVASLLVGTSADDPLLDVAFDGPPGWRMVRSSLLGSDR